VKIVDISRNKIVNIKEKEPETSSRNKNIKDWYGCTNKFNKS
jgi:hypothetical protein